MSFQNCRPKNILQLSNIPRILLIAGIVLLMLEFWELRRQVFLLSEFWGFNWLHLVNLIFHEAGHFIFFWAPRQVMVFMGTGLQIIVPFGVMIGFFQQRDWFAASIMAWWGFQNVFDSSYYIADGEKRNLPLITGDPDSHDWWYLLREWGILDQADEIGRVVMLVGFGGMILTVGWMIATLFCNSETK
jgi:hypothetical protein